MYRTIELIYDTLGTKREQLRDANEKKESHIRDLCSQQQAISSLTNDIELLESELKALKERQRENYKQGQSAVGSMPSENNCALAAGPGHSTLEKASR